MAAVIVIISLSPDLNSKLMVVAIVVGIMLLNLLVMFFARRIFNTLSLILVLLGAVLGVVQVALGAKIIYNSLITLLAS